MSDDFSEDSVPKDPVEIPITGELDLHTFRPQDIGELLPEYFLECQKRGILEVRVVHGKGIGTLRRTVKSIVEKSPLVVSFRTGDETEGSWGATIVRLISKIPCRKEHRKMQ